MSPEAKGWRDLYEFDTPVVRLFPSTFFLFPVSNKTKEVWDWLRGA